MTRTRSVKKPDPEVDGLPGRAPYDDTPSLERSAQENRDRLRQMAAVAGKLSDFRPQKEVVKNAEAVPTVFPSFDVATEVGGYPLARVVLVTGPAANGKTQFMLGVGRGFLEAGHFFAVADAERTLTQDFVKSMVGPVVDHPGFTALPVGTYEQTRTAVRRYFETIANARARGELPPDTTALLAVDSLRKLMPAGLWKALTDEVKAATEEDEAPKKKSKFVRSKKPGNHVDGIGGRAGQIKAAFNGAWMDELVPVLADSRCGILIIGREKVEEGQGKFDRDVVTPSGGVSLMFEPSLWLRCVSNDIAEKHGEGKSEETVMVGQRITLEFRKTKVARRREFLPTAFFHVSNGRGAAPEGFDFARDLFWVGQELGLVEQSGSYYSFDGEQLGQGERNAHRRIVEDAPLAAALAARIRADAEKARGIRSGE